MIDQYDIDLIKELKEYIREYNIRYYREEKDWFKKKYPLPTIGFEIKNKEKLPGIDSNYDDDHPIFDKYYGSNIEIQKALNDIHDVLFSVVFYLDHKKIIWRLKQSEDLIYSVETVEEESTDTSLGNRNYKNEKHDKINTVVSYISAQIRDTFEKYPPK